MYSALMAAWALLLGMALIYLDARVSLTFEDRKWEIPAKVYARPLELFPGKHLAPADLEYELSLLGYQAVRRLQRHR